MKRMLMTATVPSMIGQFNMNNISILLDMGYEVHVACNFKDRTVWPEERVKGFIEELKRLGVSYHQIDFSRDPKNIGKMILAYKQVERLIKLYKFNLVHCHTPIAGAITRIVCYRNHVKVIYTAHGFHFYTGAPKKNWLIYYPVEKMLSYITDILITINREDYKRAKKKFKAGKVLYIPGVGIETDKFSRGNADIEKKRKELGLLEKDIMLLSVGELCKRKNHEIVIRALKRVDNPRIHYFIAGSGELEESYKNLVKEINIDKNVHFLGYRKDISELCQAADLYIFPSIQEGLPVALMEAIACKTPVICSDIRGNSDLVRNRECLFDPENIESVIECIQDKIHLSQCDQISMEMGAEANYRRLFQYDLQAVKQKMDIIYKESGGVLN